MIAPKTKAAKQVFLIFLIALLIYMLSTDSAPLTGLAIAVGAAVVTMVILLAVCKKKK